MKVMSLFGEEAKYVVEILKNVKEITDDEIAAKTEIRLNNVRKILYKLYDHSLVGLRRTRDKNTGWFVFHWRFQPDQIEGFILNKKRRILEKLEARLNYEKNNDFYSCSTSGCRRIPFGEAMESFFRCPTCDKPMMHIDNNQIIEELEKKIEDLKRELVE